MTKKIETQSYFEKQNESGEKKSHFVQDKQMETPKVDMGFIEFLHCEASNQLLSYLTENDFPEDVVSLAKAIDFLSFYRMVYEGNKEKVYDSLNDMISEVVINAVNSISGLREGSW